MSGYVGFQKKSWPSDFDASMFQGTSMTWENFLVLSCHPGVEFGFSKKCSLNYVSVKTMFICKDRYGMIRYKTICMYMSG